MPLDSRGLQPDLAPSSELKDTYVQFMRQRYCDNAPDTTLVLEMEKVPLENMLFARYGVDPPASYNATAISDAVLFPQACGFLNLTKRKVSAHIEAATRDLITYLTSKAERPPSIPSICSDLLRSAYTNSLMTFTLVQVEGQASPWYLVTSRSRDVGWKLVVKDALTACQIARLNLGPSRYEVAEYLLDHGIEFKTLLPCPYPIEQMWPAPQMPLFRKGVPLGLGIRPPNHQFSLLDYAIYEDMRDRLLQSPRGRAALMRGGIVWRLAMESLGFEDVLLGPDGNYTKGDLVVMDGQPFVDDELSDHELDIICGVYRTLSGKCGD